MTTEIKFTDDELKSIADIQSRFEKTVFQLGEIQIKKYMIQEELTQSNERESVLKQNYLNIQLEEEKLLQDLTAKYGEGTLNAKTGTFTPAQKG